MDQPKRRKYERSPDPLRAMHERARAAGVECLDAEWLGCGRHYRFRCQLGHEWRRTAQVQRNNPRCPQCSRALASSAQRKEGIFTRILQAAKDRGGVCVTPEYLGAQARYSFVCAEGHSWEAPAYHVVASGTWCRKCAYAARRGIAKTADAREKIALAKRLDDGLQRLQAFAASRGGVCLSGEYAGCRMKYRFRCGQGHEFETLGNNVSVHGTWCRECVNDLRRLSLDDARREAQARGGHCLSGTYVNTRTRMVWQCHRGHEWKASFAGVRRGNWCKQCASLALISNRKSKARLKYLDAGAKLVP